MHLFSIFITFIWWQDELFPYRKSFTGKMKQKKKDDFEQNSGLANKKLKILNDGMNFLKVRDLFLSVI